MIRAVVNNGRIWALDPLPREWIDGRELQIEAVEETSTDTVIDAWVHDLESLAAQIDRADIASLETALRRADEEAKNHTRREMGLA